MYVPSTALLLSETERASEGGHGNGPLTLLFAAPPPPSPLPMQTGVRAVDDLVYADGDLVRLSSRLD